MRQRLLLQAFARLWAITAVNLTQEQENISETNLTVKGSKYLEEVNMDLERESETVVPFWNHTRLSEQLKEVVDQMQNRSRQQAGTSGYFFGNFLLGRQGLVTTRQNIFWPFFVTNFFMQAGTPTHPPGSTDIASVLAIFGGLLLVLTLWAFIKHFLATSQR